MSKGDTTQGVRVELNKEYPLPIEMGEYGKNPEDGLWYFRTPASGFGIGNLASHDITEYEDGTITVSPSILVYGSHNRTWHGYLKKGIWCEV